MINKILYNKRIKFFIFYCYIFINYEFIIGNDFTSFSQGDETGFLRTPSTSQLQTDVAPKREKQPKILTKKQISLLKNANIQRNGIYIMLTGNIIPIQRYFNDKDIYVYSMGMGIRTGVISYIDNYIGMRGYFAFDFTNDKLSVIPNNTNYNGTFLMISLGLDMLIDFFVDKNYKNTLGFFMGIGAGAFIYFDLTKPIIIPNSNKMLNYHLSGNVMVQGGFSAVFLYRHRIEIGCKFLPTQSLSVLEDGMVADYNPYIAYSYKF